MIYLCCGVVTKQILMTKMLNKNLVNHIKCHRGVVLLIIKFFRMNVLHEATARSFQYIRLNQKTLTATGAKNLSNSDLGIYVRLLCYLPDFDATNGIINLSAFAVKHDFGGYRKEAFFEALERMQTAGVLEYEKNSDDVDKSFRKRGGRGESGQAVAQPLGGHDVTTTTESADHLVANVEPVCGQPEVDSNDSASLLTINKEEINSISNKELTRPTNPTEVYMMVMPILSAYPRKDGKGRAMEYFGRSIKTADDIEKLKLATSNYLKHIQAHDVQYRYIKALKTFANEWKDWIDPDPSLLTPFFKGTQNARKSPQDTLQANLDQKSRLDSIFDDKAAGT